MRRCLAIVGATVLLLGLGSQADAAKGLIGKWSAQSMKKGDKTRKLPAGMKLTIEFAKGGVFIGTMEAAMKGHKPKKRVQRGTWEVKGKTLTTKTKKTETMTFKIKGKTLTLTKPDRGEVLILKRVK